MRAALLLVAACGRVGFDAAGDGGLSDGSMDASATVDGATGSVGLPPGVTVVGSVGTAGTMAGAGGASVGDLRVVTFAWKPSANMDSIAIADTAGDDWKQPFAPVTAGTLRFAMFYSIASSSANTVTATIIPAPANSAMVLSTFGGQGAFVGQTSGQATGSGAAQMVWFPKLAGLGVIGLASDVDVGATGLTPAGNTVANAIRIHVYATTANQNVSIPLAMSGDWDIGGFSFQP